MQGLKNCLPFARSLSLPLSLKRQFSPEKKEMLENEGNRCRKQGDCSKGGAPGMGWRKGRGEGREGSRATAGGGHRRVLGSWMDVFLVFVPRDVYTNRGKFWVGFTIAVWTTEQMNKRNAKRQAIRIGKRKCCVSMLKKSYSEGFTSWRCST